MTGQRGKFKDLKTKREKKERYSGKKKPRGKELTGEEKAQNKVISSIRVRVEHAIGRITRMQITTDKFRNKSIVPENLMEGNFKINLGVGSEEFAITVRSGVLAREIR